MAEIQIVPWNKKVQMNKEQVVRFQVLFLCHMKGVKISDADLSCLTLLGLEGNVSLTSFCDKLTSLGIYKSRQSGRNALGRLENSGIVTKEGKNRKRVYLSKELGIVKDGNILLDIKCFSPNVS